MKKLWLIILPLLTIFAGATLVFAQNNAKGDINMNLANKKILVAYFSWGGNTESIAKKIHAKTNGDIFKIEPATPYPKDYNETAYGIAKEQKEKGIHPPIKNTDISSYDVIFVGTPVWWYTMAPPVMTFLDKNNFEGKIIIPFITHGSGGSYTIDKDMEKLTKGVKVLSPFVVQGKGTSQTDKDITEWINKLK